MKNIVLIISVLFSELLFAQTATAPSVGDGSAANPYQIATLENLYWITASDAVVPDPDQATRWTKYYRQTADIDATATSTWDGGDGWWPIGNWTINFTGNYDGNGHTISNLYLNRTDYYSGLFGFNEANATVSNLSLLNVNITCDSYAGGLIAFTAGTVTNCSVTGTVDAAELCGGLIGKNYGTVSNSYSNCSVTATSKAGGLCGSNSSQISKCFSTGNVTRKSGSSALTLGGFVGENASPINYCYSTGRVIYAGTSNPVDKGFVGVNNSGTYTSNFFDGPTSQQTSGTGATAKTTVEMKTQSTFTDAGWNFTTLWKIIGTNYPSLHPIIYVKSGATGKNNGTSWTHAYTSFQPALDLAAAYQQIWVAKGTYKPSSVYDLTNTSRYYHFRMVDGVAIYGGFAGTETAVSQRTNFGVGGTNETILSGDIGTAGVNTDNCYHVFYHPDSYGLTSSAIINGFTIKYGYAEVALPDGNPFI